MIKTDIKQRLRDFHLHTCNEAADHIQILETTHKNLHDHITAQEKRIAEMEAQIAAQVGHEIADNRAAFELWAKKEFSEYFEDDGESMFNRAKSNDYKNLLLRNALGPFQAGAEWQAARTTLSEPADAIDAERYRDIRDVFAAGHVQQNMFFEIVRTICRDRKSTRLNSSHIQKSRMPSSA